MNQKIIKISYHADIDPVLPLKQGDWIDLRAAETVHMKAGEHRLISLGISMQLPEGYEALLLPRSSTLNQFGIIAGNSMGVIDESYCGNDDIWKFSAYAIRDTVINKNARICQFRIIEHQPPLVFEEVPVLSKSNRGGFGSTGV